MRRIAIINQKGGVGKTTTTVNMAAALAEMGQRVEVIDLDPQAHATLHLGVDIPREGPSIYNVLTGSATLAEVRRQVAAGLWLVGAHIDLAAAEVELAGVVGREIILRDLLEAERRGRQQGNGPVGPQPHRCSEPVPSGELPTALSQPGDGAEVPPFDYSIIDCPPSLGILTLNALTTADEVIIPLQPHFLALHGLSKLLETIALVWRRVNHRLVVAGIVLCMVEAGTRLGQEVVEDLAEYLEKGRGRRVPWAAARIFSSRIRRNIRLAECPSFGQSIFRYAPKSHGAEDYRALAQEVHRLPAAEPVQPAA